MSRRERKEETNKKKREGKKHTGERKIKIN